MKKGLILLGALPVALLTATFWLTNDTSDEGAYQTRNTTHLEEYNSIEGYHELMYKLKGDYTREDYLRVKAEVDAMPSDRATYTWWEHGPDNVGGRCRAVIVDQDDVNHVYAGSVSGGLFESIERANFWTPVELFNDNLAVSSICQTADGTIYVATGYDAEITSGSQNAYDSGANGNGIYRLDRNADGETIDVVHLTGSENYTFVNEIVCDTINNKLWVATNQGLVTYDPGTGNFDNVSNGLSAGSCRAIRISKDGTLVVAGMASGKTNISNDGGANFLDMTQSGNTANPISAGAGRMEYAISHEKGTNGNYYVYAVGGNQSLSGVWMSADNGNNWTQIAPANNQQPGSFAPFTQGTNGQAWWNMVISVQKGNPEKCFIGGLNIYSWATTGNWSQLSSSQAAKQSSFYVHADNHEIFWDQWGRMYIANDGGIHFSDDGGQSFTPANRGLNVTQYYEIGASAHGDVIGGAQDNGSTANYHDNSTWHEFDDVYHSDGFSNHISFINRNILFSSRQYGGFVRSADRGVNQSEFVPDEFATTGTNNLGCIAGSSGGNGCGQFFSNSQIWENPNDLNSTDSISYVPQQDYSIGDTVLVPSRTTQTNINYICPINVEFQDTVNYNPGITSQDTIISSIAPSNDYNLSVFDFNYVFGGPSISAGDSIYLVDIDTTVVVQSFTTIDHYYATNPSAPGDTLDMGNDSVAYGISWDTLLVQDPYQSWMAIGLGGGDGIWMTRNALRFSAPAEDWFKVNPTNCGEVSTMEFSRDGNHLFVGTWSGQLFRLSGFGQIYSPRKSVDTLLDVQNGGTQITTWTQIGGAFGAPITGIGVDGDPDHVVVTLGNFSGSNKVRESWNATTTGSFTSIAGDLPNGLPCYSVVIDRNDDNLIFVGTEFGVYVTEDGGVNWVDCSGKFGKSPVFDMLQNWRTWDEGCYRPGEIYIGIHGRGIWSSEDVLSLPGEQDNLKADKYISNINVYPNPMVDQGNIAFSVESSTNVTIQIFSLSGQLIQEINETNVSAGENNVSFGVSELSKGTYIIRLTAGDKVETSKFIKR